MNELVYAGPRYRLELAADGLLATISGADGRPWAALRPLAALDTVDGPDETLAVAAPIREGDTFVVARRSTQWSRASVTLVCTERTLELRTSVAGQGRLASVHLLGCRSLIPGQPTGFLPSGSSFASLFNPNPGDPLKVVRPASEPAVIGVSGDGTPGRGHWLFTPAPLWFGLTTARLEEPGEAEEGWVGLGIAGPVEELSFVEVEWIPGDRAFSLALDYEGHTIVEGDFDAPALVLTPGLSDPYEGLRRHRTELVERACAPAPLPRETPAWWSEPLFCGWGAQCFVGRESGRPAPELSIQAQYDDFLTHLEARGVVPGTVVIDDKWQVAYGTNRPDGAKWPDLRGWIARRHEAGQHVLLWWKAWDPEGLPAELCIRNPEGEPLALDPTSLEARALLRESIFAMLGPDGLDADGLKIDFSARTPSGRALTVAGKGWGIALLHDLLELVYAAAKEAKSEALVITHTPHPAFVDVTDMIRLNDMVRTDDAGPRGRVVPQMRFRAEVAQAACPELLIDTDDWSAPSLEEWREYVEEKPLLGIPSLYYAHSLDSTGESFEPRDYEALRRTWAQWRRTG